MNPPGSGVPAHPATARLPELIAALVCVHASMSSTRVIGSLMLLHQGHAAWTVGVLQALFGAGPLFISLWAGRAADRHGLARPLGLAVALTLAGTAVAALLHTPAALAWAALATGGGLAAASVSLQHAVGETVHEAGALRRAFAWLALAPALSNALAPLLAGVLIDEAGFIAALAAAALLPLPAAWLWWRLPRPVGGAPHAAPDAGPPLAPWRLLHSVPLRTLLAINVALAASWDALLFVVPVLGHARGLSASAIGLVLGAFALAVLVVRLALSRWGHRLDEGRTLQAALAWVAAVCAAYAWLPGTVGMAAGALLAGVALGAVQPMVLSALHHAVAPAQRGQAVGLRLWLVNGATLVMPLAFGALATLSLAAPLWAAAAGCAAMLGPARRLPAAREPVRAELP